MTECLENMALRQDVQMTGFGGQLIGQMSESSFKMTVTGLFQNDNG